MKICPLCKRSWEEGFRVCPIDGLALQASVAESDPFAGQSMGQTKIGEKIADGDQGPIYRADDPAYGAIAVQFIRAEKLASPILLEAFEEAIKSAARVNHPNVVRIYSSQRSADGGVAVLMEYVTGSNFDSYRRDHGPMDLKQALQLMKEASEGVLAAHRLSMLHGSLQPSRILISSGGTAKVCGFHRSALRDDIFSTGGSPSGLCYLAPERIGIVRDIPVPDYRADVYSLGAILYELLAGKLPYSAQSIQDLAAAMDAGPPLPPSFSNPQVSPTLSRVVLKSLSRHPSDRHRSVEEWLRELEAARQPMREPERDSIESRYKPARPAAAQDDSGLFAPVHASRKESADSLWPDSAPAKDAGEGSFFGWFKTRVDRRSRARESGLRPGADESIFPSRGSSRIEDDSEERTVLVSGAKNRPRRRNMLDSFTSFGRDQDLTGTDALPRRRLSSKVYLLMGTAGLVLIAVIVTLILIFGGAPTGKLTIESSPSGAQIFLNDEFKGTTPQVFSEIKADVYRLRLQLEGYESAAASIEVGPKSDVQRSFPLIKQNIPQVALLPPLVSPNTPPAAVAPTVVGPAVKPPYESLFNEALRSRNFFPPAGGNAWDVLQSWRQKEAAAPTAALEQAQASFCRELEKLGLEKLDQRDFQYVRGLLEQIRNRLPGQACAGNLQSRFDEGISRSLAELRNLLRAAMNRQSYVTPETDNALKYARLILHVDPQDAEARALDNELYARALEQARVKSDARDHQEAMNILLQLRANYPDRPGGLDAINQGIEREKQKLSLLAALKIPFSVQVKHGHSFLRLTKRDCTGVLRVDGFTIEYQSTGDHSFKVTYDLLKSVSFGKGKIVLESSAIPDGKCELEQADKNPNPTLAEVYSKIEEYRKLREQYLRPKPANP